MTRPINTVAAMPVLHPLLQLLRRLHFYAGVFIGPFIFIAALTGTLYVLTPQLEDQLYGHLLSAPAAGNPKPLSSQIMAAQRHAGDLPITAVRPAPHPEEGDTTRVLFAHPDNGPSESLAVFINPSSLDVLGMEKVYGTSGSLPFRTALDYLHASLLLGDIGRHYSEIAASWLWLVSLGGIIMWAVGRRHKRRTTPRRRLTLRRLHLLTGMLLLVIFLFLSVTGLTWSRWAGDNISQLRSRMDWLTPALNTSLTSRQALAAVDEHAHHRLPAAPQAAGEAAEVYPALFDWAKIAALKAGIDAAKIEIRPSYESGKAWSVAEIDRRWPTQVDSVALNPQTFAVTDKVLFSSYGLLAKMTRWGIDAHMGILFGLPNQLIMAAAGIGLCIMIITGYAMWLRRRPLCSTYSPVVTLCSCYQQLNPASKACTVAITLALGSCLPMLGASFSILLLADYLRWHCARRKAGVPPRPCQP